MTQLTYLSPELKDKWVKALRSGDYKQTTGTIARRIDGGIGMGLRADQCRAFCCLGVLAAIYRPDALFYFDETVMFNSGLLSEKLIALNDENKLPFSKIADYIEENYREPSAEK